MSDMLNHYYCGRQSLETLPAEMTISRLIAAHYDAFRLGTQGPDFFFYGFPLSVGRRQSALPFGGMIHRRHIDDFFEAGFDFAFSHPDTRDLILCYLAGFSCHHALDTATHPYIYYRTGCYDKTDSRTRIYAYYHKLLEVLLDVAFSQFEYGRQGCYFNLPKIFTVTPATKTALEAFYAQVLPAVFGDTPTPGSIARSIERSRRLARTFGDAPGRKKKMLRRFERIVGEEHCLSRAMYPLYTNEFLVLNLGHDTWCHPITGEQYHESYPDLFKAGVAGTVSRLGAISAAADAGSFSREAIHNQYGDLSYLTARPWQAAGEMRTFDLIFENHPELLDPHK
jgi:hypothetical protein